ncbi:PqqD family protein [Mucilaginibacter sp.]|uniref:PqqD family protein n=1 Tax=Mucilaginibacter sp. TaxID=1882438 RepID=UPI00285245B1|nr:PqqD family protein [Mucilaginibacter sp.]MDR3697518.1 PqqD family protein [Mucilaginibacter sp.]
MTLTTQPGPDTIIQRNESKFLANSLGDEIVMMNMDSGDYLGINSVGSDIWNLLGEPITIALLIKNITAIYDVSEEQCIGEVNIFLTKMIEHDMLIVQAS